MHTLTHTHRHKYIHTHTPHFHNLFLTYLCLWMQSKRDINSSLSLFHTNTHSRRHTHTHSHTAHTPTHPHVYTQAYGHLCTNSKRHNNTHTHTKQIQMPHSHSFCLFLIMSHYFSYDCSMSI